MMAGTAAGEARPAAGAEGRAGGLGRDPLARLDSKVETFKDGPRGPGVTKRHAVKFKAPPDRPWGRDRIEFGFNLGFKAEKVQKIGKEKRLVRDAGET